MSRLEGCSSSDLKETRISHIIGRPRETHFWAESNTHTQKKWTRVFLLSSRIHSSASSSSSFFWGGKRGNRNSFRMITTSMSPDSSARVDICSFQRTEEQKKKRSALNGFFHFFSIASPPGGTRWNPQILSGGNLPESLRWNLSREISLFHEFGGIHFWKLFGGIRRRKLIGGIHQVPPGGLG